MVLSHQKVRKHMALQKCLLLKGLMMTGWGKLNAVKFAHTETSKCVFSADSALPNLFLQNTCLSFRQMCSLHFTGVSVSCKQLKALLLLANLIPKLLKCLCEINLSCWWSRKTNYLKVHSLGEWAPSFLFQNYWEKEHIHLFFKFIFRKNTMLIGLSK